MQDEETVELAVIFTGVESEAAYKIVDPASETPMWIPFSQTRRRDGELGGGPGTITITEWMARKKGLIE